MTRRRRSAQIPDHLLAGATVRTVDAAALEGAARAAGVPASRSKYRNKPTVYNGVRYASKAEAARAEQLDVLVGMGAVAFWLGQPKFRLGCPENVYVADFLVIDACIPTRRIIGAHVEDVKGLRTAKFNRDIKLWRKYGPCPLWVITKGRTAEIIEPGR